MQIIRDPAETASIADPELRALVEKTIRDLSEDHPCDPAELGFFLIVDKGDSLETINSEIGFNILANRWTGIRFDQPGYTQSFEILEEHAIVGWFEMVFVIGQDGFGIELFIPKTEGIDPDLLAMCQRYAVPAPVMPVAI